MTQILDNSNFTAEFNSELDGYIVFFKKTKHIAQTQFYIEGNALHGGYGEKYLERYIEYDSELTEDEIKSIDIFIGKMNKSGEF